MRVMFDAFWWARGPGANRSVQRELIQAWDTDFPEDEVFLAVRAGHDHADAPTRAQIVQTHLWPQALANRWELPRLGRRHGCDLLVAHNYAPRSGRSAVFIHDLLPHDHPQWFSRAERIYFSPFASWARSAATVATSTRTEAERIIRVSAGRLAPVAIGLGVPSPLTQAQPVRPSAATAEQFALTVGRLNVRKNLAAIIQATAEATRITPASPLYIVGSTAHSGVGTALTPAQQALVDSGQVVFLGHLRDAELAWLYRHSALTINLSLDEGFGLPAIEAAHFGAPLLVSDIPVFAETVGDYAQLVAPTAPSSQIGKAIDQAWATEPPAAAQRRISTTYTWSAAVARLRAACGSSN